MVTSRGRNWPLFGEQKGFPMSKHLPLTPTWNPLYKKAELKLSEHKNQACLPPDYLDASIFLYCLFVAQHLDGNVSNEFPGIHQRLPFPSFFIEFFSSQSLQKGRSSFYYISSFRRELKPNA